MNDLVSRLSIGRHSVSAERYKSREEFDRAVGRGYVLVKFTETRGGTELGLTIDRINSSCDRDSSSGRYRLVGSISIDYVPAICEVEIETETLRGTGILTPVTQ